MSALRRLKSLSLLYVSTALVFGAPLCAQAQTAGNYSGSAADGTTINFTVDTDPMTGKLQIDSFGFGMNEACTGNTQLQTGWGISMAQDIVGGHASLVFPNGYYDQYLYIKGDVTFTGTTATGTIESVSPALKAKSKKGVPVEPTAALFCKSASQTFTVSYTGAAAAAASVPGTISVFHIARPIGNSQ